MSDGDPFDRHIQQAILGMKKGAHIFKCRRRGKPKFCPFRLSTDEKYLMWCSGHKERQLRLSSVTDVLTGHKMVNFQRQFQSNKEQSISLIYANGERSLDLICKDKAEADFWFVGLKAVISRCNGSKSISGLRSHREAQSCISSPAAFIRRKHKLGLGEDKNKDSQQVRSLCTSPSLSFSDRGFSDGLSCSSDSFYSPRMQFVLDTTLQPTSPYQKNISNRFAAPLKLQKNEILKDVMIWGEGVVGGSLCGNPNGLKTDALLPKLLESATMLGVQHISLGATHAALVTGQGEVFCWGDENGGRLGHKNNIDISNPKLVQSLSGVVVKSVVCGEYQTCALTESGEVYTWGTNFHAYCQWLPHKVRGPLDGVTVVSVSCGEWHTALVSSSGQLFTYGDGTFGVLGHGNTQSLLQPKQVESLKGMWVKCVSCGPWHMAAIVEIVTDGSKKLLNNFNAGGKLFTWGDGDKGRLGHSDSVGAIKRFLPTHVEPLADLDFVQVCCGTTLTAALTSSGMVYTMGSAIYGQLGNPQAKDKSITAVGGRLRQEIVREISLGSYHVAVLTTGGNVYTWGKGTNGQLGLGDNHDRNSPTLVEFLKDQQVESIACGSSITAAICLHKSFTISDQSVCRRCKMPFGFTRKKHNCYNCGFLFCHACSSRKVVNASLAPNKSKPCRVCKPCFSHLHYIINNSSKLLKHETQTTWQPLTPHRIFLDEKEAVSTKKGLLSIISSSIHEENQGSEKKSLKTQSEKQQYLEADSHLSGTTRWGQVSWPVLFKGPHCGNNSSVTSLLCTSRLPLDDHDSLQEVKSPILSSITLGRDLPESNEMLNQEVQKLQAEARSPEKQCQIGSQEIEECQKGIEHTLSDAKEEAEKCKAAKEMVKALALRVHSMSEKLPGGRDQKSKLEPKMIHEVETQGQGDSVCGTPIVFPNKLKSGGRDEEREQNGSIGSKLEWVEQYEVGVYFTFTILASGGKGLKRVRFSRKRFTEKKAKQWWEDNQRLVYRKYGIEEYFNSNQNQSKS